MARPVRIERPGGWYHITGRGIERRRIFDDDRDRRRWLTLLSRAVPMFHWLVHGYTLMDNHYHLIVQIQELSLSKGMQWLQTSYSMGYNRRHGRVGPLVQGRFDAVIVDPVSWGLELSRYVHLNPVRTARMGLDKRARQADRLGVRGRPDPQQVRRRIHRLRNYRWSSLRAYLGLEKAPEWLTCGAVLSLIGSGTRREQQRAYRRYVEDAIREGLPVKPWEHLQANLILGTKQFLEELRSKVDRRHREQPQSRKLRRRADWHHALELVEKLCGRKWEIIRDRHGDWGRELLLYLGRRHCGLSLRELGEIAGGIDYAAISVAIKRFEKRLLQDSRLSQTVQTVERQLLNVET